MGISDVFDFFASFFDTDAVYLVDDAVYLHLRQGIFTRTFNFTAYDSQAKRKITSGKIRFWPCLHADSFNDLITARSEAIKRLELPGKAVIPLQLDILETLRKRPLY